MKSLLACAVLVSAPLAAQTFVVDAAGGPGAQFTNLATAVAAVPDGSTLLVRPGNYSTFTIDAKSLTLLADPGVLVDGLVSVGIMNLAAHQQVALRGFEIKGISTTGQIICTDNVGTVLIESCSGVLPFSGGRLVFIDCRDARVSQCILQPIAASAIHCTDSNLRVARTAMVGAFASTTVEAVRSTVELADVFLAGVGGWVGNAPFDMVNSSVRVLGTSLVTGAATPFGVSGQLFDGTGQLRIDPAATLIAPGSVPFGPLLGVTTQSMPVVAASTGTAGGLANATLLGPSGGIGALFLGLTGPPITVAPFVDAILIRPGTENLQAIGAFGPPLTASYVVPPQPLLLGLRVAWQGASIDAVSGAQISNAVTYVHW